MVVHAVDGVPETHRVAPVGNNSTIEKRNPCCLESANGKLMVVRPMQGTVVVMDSQVPQNDVGNIVADVNHCRTPIIAVVRLDPFGAKLGIDNARPITALSDKSNEALRDKEFFMVRAVPYENRRELFMTRSNSIKSPLNCREVAIPVLIHNEINLAGNSGLTRKQDCDRNPFRPPREIRLQDLSCKVIGYFIDNYFSNQFTHLQDEGVDNSLHDHQDFRGFLGTATFFVHVLQSTSRVGNLTYWGTDCPFCLMFSRVNSKALRPSSCVG